MIYAGVRQAGLDSAQPVGLQPDSAVLEFVTVPHTDPNPAADGSEQGKNQRPTDAMIHKGFTEQRARRDIRRARALAAAMMPFDEWKRENNPTAKEEAFARLVYEEPAKMIAYYIEIFGPQVAE